MRRQIFIILITALTFGCSDNSSNRADKSVTGSPRDNKNDSLTVDTKDLSDFFADSGQSSVNIKKHKEGGFVIQTTERSYSYIYIAPSNDLYHYLQKRTTTTEFTTFSEGQNRTIEVELIPIENPEQKKLRLKENCDEMIFEVNYYKTLKHGCCATPTETKIFNYKNDLIISGEDNIIRAYVANKSPDRDFWVSYSVNNGTDKKLIGTICISYNPQNKYFIDLKTMNETDSLYETMWFTPDFRLASMSSKDKMVRDNTEFEIWSLEGIKSFNEINGISIKVPIYTKEIPDTLEIPIVNGRPFGKSDRQQQVIINEK